MNNKVEWKEKLHEEYKEKFEKFKFSCEIHKNSNKLLFTEVEERSYKIENIKKSISK